MINFLLDSLWAFFIDKVYKELSYTIKSYKKYYRDNKNNKKFHKQFSSSWAYLLLIPLPLFFVLFFAGGCSFKYMDPQYYEFLRLCREAENVVYDEELYRIYNTRKGKERYYDEKTQREYFRSEFETKDSEAIPISWSLRKYKSYLYYKEKLIAYNEDFWYDHYGLFLWGDEAAGWHWERKLKLYCSKGKIETRRN